MKILITGGTGLVGKKLGLALVQRGDSVTVVTRGKKAALRDLPFPVEIVEGDLSKRAIPALAQTSWDAVVHLMGENVGQGRWTPAVKTRLVNSRILATKHLIESLRPENVKSLISASAVGYYGDRGEEELTEESGPSSGFLSDLCRDWEELTLNGMKGPRTAVARIGFILDHQEGGLPRLIDLFQKGLGSPLSSGKQWMTWVHVDDVVNGFLHLIDHQNLKGVFNLVAPHPTRNQDFTKSMAKVLNCFTGPNVPAFALKTLYGEMAQIILSSQNVKPKRLQASGFKFKFDDMETALTATLSGFANGHSVFETKQFIPRPKEAIFPFFADAKNLEQITPPNLNFHILKVSTPDVQQGTLIDYKLTVHKVPVRWRTEIATWSPPNEFTDNQLKGPYQKWHHVHSFENLADGTLMTDRVTYKLPLGLIGRIGGAGFVRSDVNNIFGYRRQVIFDLYGEK